MGKKARHILGGILGAVILVLFDQWTKHQAVVYLKDQDPIVLIKGVFELHYLENKGAAFGILQGRMWIFFICTAAVLVFIGFIYLRLPDTRRFIPLRITAVLIAAGAVGNLIDRLANSYVVDFLYFKLIDFPVFNVADCYVTAGAVMLAILVLFVYRDGEFEALSGKKNAAKN